MSYNIYWIPRIYCLSPPHIYSRTRCRHPSLFHLSHHNHCYSNRGKSFQLTRHTSWRKHQMITCYTLSLRIYFPFYNRRSYRNRISQLIPRHRSSRYLLCSSPLPLCTIYRSRICYHRRLCPLIPTIHRIYTK